MTRAGSDLKVCGLASLILEYTMQDGGMWMGTQHIIAVIPMNHDNYHMARYTYRCNKWHARQCQSTAV